MTNFKLLYTLINFDTAKSKYLQLYDIGLKVTSVPFFYQKMHTDDGWTGSEFVTVTHYHFGQTQ